jgi:hypothetical protein
MDKDRWRESLSLAALQREIPIRAETFLRAWPSFSRPVAVVCSDGLEYVIKGPQIGRAVINDQVVARLGIAMNAPVGKAKLVEVPSELVDIEPQLSHIQPGVAHGSLFTPDCSDRSWIAYTDEPGNRLRFALLSILYGWAHANDHQLIYGNREPHLVLSVDHGHFFPNGPNWSETDLQNCPAAQPEHALVSGCNLTGDELSQAMSNLRSVTEEDIIQAVAAPPDEWGITIDERITMVEYFLKRQREILLSIDIVT